jgi:hypothetical protein
MRIKLFEDFNSEILSTILDEVDMCLVDLRDKGFTWIYNTADYNQINISLHRIDNKGFKPDEIKDSIETMIEYFDEKYGVKSYSITKPDSPGPGIEVDLNDRYNRNIFWLNIKINLGRED